MALNIPTEAFPLTWPVTRQRTEAWKRERAKFHRKVERQSICVGTYHAKEALTIADSRNRLYRELEALGALRVIISSNLRLKIDGTPLGSQSNPSDPGVAVYFQMNQSPHCLSCDLWDRAADNLAAIAKHVEAMRGQIRWGVADVATMFSGFRSLPAPILAEAPMTREEAIAFLAKANGLTVQAVVADVRGAYQLAAMKFHPDRNDGQETDQWRRLQRAKDAIK